MYCQLYNDDKCICQPVGTTKIIEQAFTLEELAEAFGLTPRNARYWIENILPPHHKKGRGKVARYGRDTWNCFAFVKKAREEKLTSEQIGRILRELDQAQIDRIAEGAEELAVVSMLSAPLIRERINAPPMPAASRRARNYLSEPDAMLDPVAPRQEAMFSRSFDSERPAWRTLYSDDELQIRHRGKAGRSQREQVKKAAELIKSILKK
jgi:DNA-binding transcriptional MerR regulator